MHDVLFSVIFELSLVWSPAASVARDGSWGKFEYILAPFWRSAFWALKVELEKEYVCDGFFFSEKCDVMTFGDGLAKWG